MNYANDVSHRCSYILPFANYWAYEISGITANSQKLQLRHFIGPI